MGKKPNLFITTKQKISNMHNVGFDKCAGCGDGWSEGEVIVSTTNKRYHFRCAKCKNII